LGSIIEVIKEWDWSDRRLRYVRVPYFSYMGDL
jgi:hypothetical protein